MFVMLHVMITSRYACRVPSVGMTVILNFVVGYKQFKNSQAPSATATDTHTHTSTLSNIWKQFFWKKVIGQEY